VSGAAVVVARFHLQQLVDALGRASGAGLVAARLRQQQLQGALGRLSASGVAIARFRLGQLDDALRRLSGAGVAPLRQQRYLQRLALLLLLALPASAAVLLVQPWSDRLNAPAYRAAQVERGDLVVAATAAGTLNAVVMVEVGSQISGQIEELYADFNSKVTQSELIARISPEMYEAKAAQAKAALEYEQALVPLRRMEIERARAELEKARAQHAAAKAAIARAELASDLTKRDFDRKRSLRTVVSPADRERSETAHLTAQAELTAVRAQELSQLAAVHSAEAAVGVAEAQLEAHLRQVTLREAALQQAQIDVKNTYIRAPVTGTVVNRKVSRGQILAASLQAPTLFTIAQDLRQMQVEASVVEADVSRFAPGQAVTFSVDAYPGRTFTGEVVQIRKAAQLTQNVVSYIVVISAENPDEALLPGMTANIRVVVAEKHDVLLVPNAALRFRPPDWDEDERRAGVSSAAAAASTRARDLPGVSGRVFVVDAAGRPSAVPLRLGASDGRMTEVLTGELSEGQAVLTSAQRSAPAPRRVGFRLL
jgi:HlyD family secretion protein